MTRSRQMKPTNTLDELDRSHKKNVNEQRKAEAKGDYVRLAELVEEEKLIAGAYIETYEAGRRDT